MSMYRQLWSAIIISTMLALAGSLLASLLSARAYLEEQLSMKNADNATALALSMSQRAPDPIEVEIIVAALFDSGHYELIRVSDPRGKTMVERSAPVTEVDVPGWFVRRLPIAATPGQAQISSGWKQFGTITLISHSRFAYRALWKSTLEMIGALAVAGLVGGFLGSLVLGRLRKPLDAVIDQAKAITERRFVTIQEPKVPELRQLAAAMNTTVTRLKAMFDEETARLETVRREANVDPLTGLINRSHFMASLRQSLGTEDSAGGTLLLIRVANLAEVNARLGRAATDEWLRRVGGAIGRLAGEAGGTLAARLNGADFAVLVDHHDGRELATSLLAGVVRESEPYVPNGASAYIGVGGFGPKTDADAILARVDAALAAAESSGVNTIKEAVSDDVDMPKSAEQWTLMINRALAAGWVRLISFPVVSLDGGLSHRECPLRLMFDADGEWLPAGRFLPIAERLKLTPALDLAAVALGLRELEQDPQHPGLAINLSAHSIESPDFRAELQALLDAKRKTAPRLWLEIPETGALKHLEELRTICRQFKSVGCLVGLEHFGRQFSQIGLLHDLGLDYIKVDASFIRDIDSNTGNQAFLKGLSAIAHNIGMKVFAEGVVSEREMAALKAVGFDGATGPAVRA